MLEATRTRILCLSIGGGDKGSGLIGEGGGGDGGKVAGHSQTRVGRRRWHTCAIAADAEAAIGAEATVVGAEADGASRPSMFGFQL